MNCACARRRLWEALFFVPVGGLSDIQTFVFFHILQMQRRRGPPPFPEEAGHRPQITWRTLSLVTMGAAKSILFSVVARQEKGQDCECKRRWQSDRVGQIKSRWRQVVHTPFVGNPGPFVLLCLTELTSWPPDISFSRHCFIPKGVATSSPFQPTFCFMLSLETFARFTFYIRSPCPQCRVVALGSKSGGEESEESEGAKSVSHNISSKRSCVTM